MAHTRRADDPMRKGRSSTKLFSSKCLRSAGELLLAISLLNGRAIAAEPGSANSSAPPAARASVAYEALSRLPDGDISDKPQIKAAVAKALSSLRGTPEFVKLVQKFHLAEQN